MKNTPTARRTPPKVPRPVPANFTISPTVRLIEEKLEKGDITQRDAEQILLDLLSQGMPLIEDIPECSHEKIVTFLHRDTEAKNVLIFINRITDEKNLSDSLLKQVGSTPFRWLSLRMKSDWRASYCFLSEFEGVLAPWESAENQVQIRSALDAGELDPANPETCLNSVGAEQSVVTLPNAPKQPFITAAQPVSVNWYTTQSERKFATYRIGAGEELPLVIVLDGEKWAQQGIISMLEAAHRAGFLPAMAVTLVHSGGRELRWQELDGTFPYTDFLVEDVIPQVQEKTEVKSFSSVVVVGQSLGGLSAIVAALQRPDIFTAAISSSASLWLDTAEEELEKAVASGRAAKEFPRLFIDVGEQEWVLLPLHVHFNELLEEKGFDVAFNIYNGGHDYACWRGNIIPYLHEVLR